MFPSHTCWAPFVFAVLLPGTRAAGSGSACHQSGADSKWYEHEYQYNYVEALILVCLIIIAIVFEQVWNRVEKEAHHAYRYGCLGKPDVRVSSASQSVREVTGRIKNECLTIQYVHRCGGEFMTLGVLAFCVFMFNNAKGFEAMANLYKDHPVPLPRSASDWLHMVELVHMKLFVGMVLYFGLIGSSVRICDKKFKKWESCRLHQVEALGKGRGAREFEIDHKADPELAQYDLWQKYFYEKIVSWKDERKHLYKALLDVMEIDAEEREVAVKLRMLLLEKFSFAQYLALNITEGMCDTIHVHPLSWACLLVLFIGFIFMHRFAEVDLFLLSLVFIGATVLLLLVMFAVVRNDKRRIRKFVDENPSTLGSQPVSSFARQESPASTSSKSPDRDQVYKIASLDQGQSINERFKTEDWAIRVLQVILFLVAYVFARTLMDFHDWEDNPQNSAMLCACFVVLYMVLMKSLQGLPTFLALAALPPYCDVGNVAYMFAIMEDASVVDPPSRGPSRQVSVLQSPRQHVSPPRRLFVDVVNETSRYVTFEELKVELAGQQLSELELREQWDKLEHTKKTDGSVEDTVKTLTMRIEELFSRVDASREDTVKALTMKIEELSERIDLNDNTDSCRLVVTSREPPQGDLDAVWKHMAMLENQMKRDRLQGLNHRMVATTP